MGWPGRGRDRGRPGRLRRHAALATRQRRRHAADERARWDDAAARACPAAAAPPSASPRACPRSSGAACTPADQQFCYKTCGPEKTGVKTDTCAANGVYAEMVRLHLRSGQGLLLLRDPVGAPTRSALAGVAPQGKLACATSRPLRAVQQPPAVCRAATISIRRGAPKVGWCTCQLPNGGVLRTWSLRQRHRVALPARRPVAGRLTGGVRRQRRGTGGVRHGGRQRGLRRGARLPVHGRQGCGVRARGSAVLLQAVRPRERRREVGDVHDGRHLRRDVGLFLRSDSRLLLLQDPGRCQRGLSVGRAPQAGASCDRPGRARSATASRATSAVSISDAAGAPKIGWCVCQPGANGLTTWSCASDTAWPCPLGAGC